MYYRDSRRGHPLLYQLNTRVYLNERSEALGRKASFDDVPDALLDEIKATGFEWLYLLGVWQTGPAAREISRANPHTRAEVETILRGCKDEDIIGSPFAIRSYEPSATFGGSAALAALRERVRSRELRLMLDFVPNHIAPDHEWVSIHPEYLIAGSKEDLAREPQNWGRFDTPAGPRVFAFGRDPYFAGWSDTVQLNYRHPKLRRAMVDQLMRVAEWCDGVRCDMAMLLEPDVFVKTWGDRALPMDGFPPVDIPFWPDAIAAVRGRYPDFTFMAEVYWDMEWRLQQRGFDFTYDKRLYDRLRASAAGEVREHLQADMAFQNRSARFLENHDEPRAAHSFTSEIHRPAALITFFVPGLRFFHEGQIEGWKVHTSMHLGRRPQEPADAQTRIFYDLLLDCLRRSEVHDGVFNLWQPRPAWEGNPTWNNFICFSWHDEGRCLLGIANYAASQSQCYVTVDLDLLSGKSFRLSDLLSSASYERSGDELRTRGLYLDLPAWGYHLFQLVPISS
jgi:alpha amylase-like protein